MERPAASSSAWSSRRRSSPRRSSLPPPRHPRSGSPLPGGDLGLTSPLPPPSSPRDRAVGRARGPRATSARPGRPGRRHICRKPGSLGFPRRLYRPPVQRNFLYGLPFISPNNILVTTINGTGSVIEAIYVVIFLIFAERKTRLRMMGLLSIVTTIFTVVVLVSLLALHGNARKIFCGLAATIFSICMYASPLSIMRLVIKTKSVEFMPFLLSLSVFLCGTSWFIYGLLGRDPFIIIPNGCGSVLGFAQLILYAIYRKNKGAAAPAGKADAAAADEVEDAKKAAAAVELADAKTNNKAVDGDKVVSQV